MPQNGNNGKITIEKKYLTRGAVGLGVAILLFFCAKQCCDGKLKDAELNRVKTELRECEEGKQYPKQEINQTVIIEPVIDAKVVVENKCPPKDTTRKTSNSGKTNTGKTNTGKTNTGKTDTKPAQETPTAPQQPTEAVFMEYKSEKTDCVVRGDSYEFSRQSIHLQRTR